MAQYKQQDAKVYQMPGARLRTYRMGDRSELLVEQLLSAFAFTTRVPRQEDVGIDFFCCLIERKENLLRAGPFFAVQAKSTADPVIYEKDHEIAWITSQENPLFLCVADRPSLAMDVYSTWNLPCGPLYKKPARITLLPGVSGDSWPGVEHMEDGSQVIRLGPPIVRVTDSDIFDDDRIEQIAAIFSEWVALDRTNIVNRHAGMFWVLGPLKYQTGQPPYASGEGGVAFYWNPANLSQCSNNLGRAATALKLIIDALGENVRGQPIWISRIDALKELLRTHWILFDDAVRSFLVSKGMQP